VAYGVTVFGKRELLGFLQAKGESQNAWETLLRSLYERGLRGENLKLLVMDGSAGLKLAAEMVYPRSKIQRCWVHKLRNVTDKVRKKDGAEVLRGAQKIYLAKNRRNAIRRFDDWKHRWGLAYPEAVRCLEKDLDDLLNFFDCPKEHWIKVRTTNAIERSFREVRRRTRVFSCFTNTASSERMIFAIFHYLNTGWMGKPLDGFTQFN
jgi:transposase-like protein